MTRIDFVVRRHRHKYNKSKVGLTPCARWEYLYVEAFKMLTLYKISGLKYIQPTSVLEK